MEANKLTPIDGVLSRLSQKLFIMRDKAAKELARMVDANELSNDDVKAAENWIVSNARSSAPEARQGAIMAAMRPEFKTQLVEIVRVLLDDDEPPVRMTVADLLPLLVEKDKELFTLMINEVTAKLPTTPGHSALEKQGSMLDTLFRALFTLLTAAKPPENMLPRAWCTLHVSTSYPFPFVRQAGLPLVSWACTSTPEDARLHSAILADVLLSALLDISPRVRFAAVVATRPFIDACCREKPLDESFPQLIPPLCLNRYFPAEGLGRICTETWQHAVGMRGRAVISHLIPAVVACYIAEAKAALPASREGACRCLSELVQKVDPQVVAPHAGAIIGCLVQLCSDPTWKIQDAALVGLGAALEHFKAQVDAAAIGTLLRARLADFIWCVRESAASALLVLQPPEIAENLATIVDLIRRGLEGFNAQQEEKETEGHKGHERAHKPGEPHPHTDEPWQLTAGALSLFRLLAVRMPAKAAPLVLLVVQVAARRITFCQRAQLLETLWSEVGVVAPLLPAALAPHWSVLIESLVRDATVAQSVRRVATKTAQAIKKCAASEVLAALPSETRAAFAQLAGDE